MSFVLPALPYASDALEPHIDKMTMEIHHGKHHQAYVDNLNKALAGTDGANASIEDIIKNISKYPMAVRNNGGGHFNHSLFWSSCRQTAVVRQAANWQQPLIRNSVLSKSSKRNLPRQVLPVSVRAGLG